jgi:hypothetical protein
MILALRFPPSRQVDIFPMRHAPDRGIAPSAPAFTRNSRCMRFRFQSSLDCRFFIIRQSMPAASGRQIDPCPMRHALDHLIVPCTAAFTRNGRRIWFCFQCFSDCRFFLLSNRGPHPVLLDMAFNIFK